MRFTVKLIIHDNAEIIIEILEGLNNMSVDDSGVISWDGGGSITGVPNYYIVDDSIDAKVGDSTGATKGNAIDPNTLSAPLQKRVKDLEDALLTIMSMM